MMIRSKDEEEFYEDLVWLAKRGGKIAFDRPPSAMGGTEVAVGFKDDSKKMKYINRKLAARIVCEEGRGGDREIVHQLFKALRELREHVAREG